MKVVNNRNMKLFLYIGNCVPTGSKPCFQTLHKHNGMYPNFSLCIQFVEYTNWDRVYKGMMTTQHKNHLHIFETSPARMSTA
jgi:hypothetical protein